VGCIVVATTIFMSPHSRSLPGGLTGVQKTARNTLTRAAAQEVPPDPSSTKDDELEPRLAVTSPRTPTTRKRRRFKGWSSGLGLVFLTHGLLHPGRGRGRVIRCRLSRRRRFLRLEPRCIPGASTNISWSDPRCNRNRRRAG
jgi:hypothetical protein